MSDHTIPHKTCTRCEKSKPATTEYFYKQSPKKDGLSSWCKTCVLEQQAEYRVANPDKVKASKKAEYERNKEKYARRSAEYQRANKDEVNERGRRRWAKLGEDRNAQRKQQRIDDPKGAHKKDRLHRERNKDSVARAQRRFRADNPDKRMVHKQKRMARKVGLPDNFTAQDWQNCLNYFDGCCAACGRPPGLFHTLAADHWIPLSSPDCTGTIPANIVPLCHGDLGCNNRKFNKDALTWLVESFGEKKGKQIFDKVQAYFSSLNSV